MIKMTKEDMHIKLNVKIQTPYENTKSYDFMVKSDTVNPDEILGKFKEAAEQFCLTRMANGHELQLLWPDFNWQDATALLTKEDWARAGIRPLEPGEDPQYRNRNILCFDLNVPAKETVISKELSRELTIAVTPADHQVAYSHLTTKSLEPAMRLGVMARNLDITSHDHHTRGDFKGAQQISEGARALRKMMYNTAHKNAPVKKQEQKLHRDSGIDR
jgi:hypothetical protein